MACPAPDWAQCCGQLLYLQGAQGLAAGHRMPPWSKHFQVELHDRSYFKEMAMFKAQGRVHDHECDPDHACLAKIVTILASRDALRRRASQQ